MRVDSSPTGAGPARFAVVLGATLFLIATSLAYVWFLGAYPNSSHASGAGITITSTLVKVPTQLKAHIQYVLENVTLYTNGTYFVTITGGEKFSIPLFLMGLCGNLQETTIGGPIYPNQSQVLRGSSNHTLSAGDICEGIISPQGQNISPGVTFTVKAVNQETQVNSFELKSSGGVAFPDGSGNATVMIKNSGGDGLVGFNVDEIGSRAPSPLVFKYGGSAVGPSNPLPPGATAVLQAHLGYIYYSAPQQPDFFLVVSLNYADGCTGLLAIEFSLI